MNNSTINLMALSGKLVVESTSWNRLQKEGLKAGIDILGAVITIPNIAQKLLLFFSVSAYYCRFLSSYVLPSGFWRTFLAHNHTFRRFVAALSTIGEVRTFLLRSMPEYPLWFRCSPRPPGATRFFYSCRHLRRSSTCSDSGKSQKCSCVTAFRIAAVCFSENDRSRATSSSLTFFLSSLVIISPPPLWLWLSA